ncbi:CpaF family protein [Pseudonocardia lutea]|uniref:CpaF family protein n=1 Tax=Pseudonocardia lutea TaxID=2172015 RepID=A0ABW1II99_9PSEU
MTADLIERLRVAVIGRLERHEGRERLTAADQRQLVRSWVEQELAVEARRRLNSGKALLSPEAEATVVRQVDNAIWGLGRLQELLDDPDIEDVHITGCDRPYLRLRGGALRVAPDPIAESDAALVEQIQYIAAHHGSSERSFSPAQPFLNMRLPDGSRLAAMREVVPRPTVTIRRHRLQSITLHDLVRMGTLSTQAAGFLRAIVAAKANVVVTGAPSSGKTTLLRCLTREIPATERIATLETEFELGLHELPGSSPLVLALEARPGSTESMGGQRAGEITLADLVHQTLRMSVTRVVVGEVRGAEALPMLEAMNSGMPGSMCTLHAGSAGDAFERLVTAAMKGAGNGWTVSFVTRLAAQGIDYVVHLRQLDHPALGGRGRVVSEIAEVTGVVETGAVSMNRIFCPDSSADDPRARFHMLPQMRWRFDEAGIDLGFLVGAQSRNGQVRKG